MMDTMFTSRQEAATRLSERLSAYRGCRPLVLAIPRGAVPMAGTIARALDGEFDVVLVRKLRAPGQDELAIGSVDESGWTYLAPFAASTGADADYIEAERQLQLQTIRRRRQAWTPLRPPIDPENRTVIVVDDGLATGATMIGALHSLRARSPAHLVCAVPVAPADTLQRIGAMADAVVCLEVPANFHAVGQFYRDFPQIDDAQVAQILRDA